MHGKVFEEVYFNCLIMNKSLVQIIFNVNSAVKLYNIILSNLSFYFV